MTIDSNDLINSILESLSRIDYIKPEDVPNIPLYMDQVTTFMDAQLSASKRYEKDKILTKTMINNYAKNNLLPSPEKKKYTREHMLVLVFIYYFKNFLTITDIQSLLNPITEKYFQAKDGLNLTDIYNEVFQLEESQVERLKQDVLQNYQVSQNTFANVPNEEQEFLRLFSFICMLSFDVYVRKMLVEKMIDQLAAKPENKKED